MALLPKPPLETSNALLGALPPQELRRLAHRLERVVLRPREVIYQGDVAMKHVYFPETAIVALVDQARDGGTMEVALIGREGMVGINVVLGSMLALARAQVIVGGTAVRMKSDDVALELGSGGPLQLALLCYTGRLLRSLSRSVTCARHHAVEQRLAAWLLSIHSRGGVDRFVMTHARIAELLGVRRSGVSEAAAALRAAGLIRNERGRVRLLDVRGLESWACDCHCLARRAR